MSDRLYAGDPAELAGVIRSAGIETADFAALVVNAVGAEPNKAGRTLLSLSVQALLAELKAEQNANSEDEILRYLNGV